MFSFAAKELCKIQGFKSYAQVFGFLLKGVFFVCLFLERSFQGASQQDFLEFEKIENDFSRSKTFRVISRSGDPLRTPFKISLSVSQNMTLTPSNISPENKMTPMT